jgi:hypothetical protein
MEGLKRRRPASEDYLKILKVEYLSNHLLDYTQILNKDDFPWKTTSKYQGGISQQPLMGPYSNFKLKLR